MFCYYYFKSFLLFTLLLLIVPYRVKLVFRWKIAKVSNVIKTVMTTLCCSSFGVTIFVALLNFIYIFTYLHTYIYTIDWKYCKLMYFKYNTKEDNVFFLWGKSEEMYEKHPHWYQLRWRLSNKFCMWRNFFTIFRCESWTFVSEGEQNSTFYCFLYINPI